ncbi:MAG: polysaccharide pyruvyl transferase family protein [Candidatus Gracilibacteria bacterium]|nr:polysaccharide pyruvyl transferase family protein [Candidatus Gracilibacteria bacterium]
MIISIFASIGGQNLGDELILKNEVKLLEKKYGKDTKFVVFSYDYKNPFLKKSNVVYREYFPIGIRDISNIFNNIKNFFVFLYTVFISDLIVIGGGGIIYDSENQSTREPLDQWLFRTRVFNFFRKNVLFFAVGLNIKDKFNYHKVKQIFSQAEVTVRDSYSHELLKELGIASTIVKDPVFSDVSSDTSKNMIIKKVNSFDFRFTDFEDIDLKGKKVAIAFRKGYLTKTGLEKNNQDEEKIINDIIDYILEKGGEVILLPNSFHKSDYLANDYMFLYNFLRINQKIRIVSTMEDVYKKYIYKEFDICLAMRLHSIILSQVYQIPFVGVSYSKKTDEILNAIEKGL